MKTTIAILVFLAGFILIFASQTTSQLIFGFILMLISGLYLSAKAADHLNLK